MRSKFGFLSKLDFLQNITSSLLSGLNPAIVHNLEKYLALYKVHYLSAIEEIEGDYIEFGVYTGSSFCHSIRCVKKLMKVNKNLSSTRFFGFDSFEGFGELSDDDFHPFYKDSNFETSYEKVDKRVKKVSKNLEYHLVKGFFNETLAKNSKSYGIEKSRIIFVDSDTYSSAVDALNFILPTIQQGSYIVLDDYFSYLGSEDRGIAKAFNEFLANGNLKARQVLNYGTGGIVYVLSKN